MTFSERETALNNDLERLLQTLLKDPPEAGNGLFYEALGQKWEALGNFSEAIWAYQKALSLSPWNLSARKSLFALQEKEHLPKEAPLSLPLPILYQGFTLSFFLFIVLWRWFRWRLTFGISSLLILGLIAYTVWLTPLEGVLLYSTYLYQSPSPQAPLVIQDPLPSGLKIEIYEVEKEGKWLKVKDNKGNIGFISYDSIRLI